MNAQTRQRLTKYWLTVLLLFILSVILVLAQRFSADKTDAAIRDAAALAIESSVGKPITVGERLAVAGTGFPGSTYAFSVADRGKAAGIAFVTPIMGNSGPYTGVFLWTADGGTRLCSLVGAGSADEPIERFGITARALDACVRKLDAIASRAGGTK